MKKASTTLLLLAFALLLFTLAPTYANVITGNVKATSSSPTDVQIDHVNHTIKIQEGALVIINDTLKLSSESQVLLTNFSLGFPYKINDKETIDALDYCFAYEPSNPDERFKVELDMGLGRLGFYGVNVVFPEPGVNIGNGEPYNLTVVFVFSNLVSSETSTLRKVVFPMYPSLIQNASMCNVTVIMPPDANFTDSIFHEKELDFNITTIGNSQILKHPKSSLESFEYEPAWIIFNMSELYAFPIIEFNEVKREITLDPWGDIYVLNSYSITNRGYATKYVKVGFPEGAYDLSAWEELGTLRTFLTEETVTVYLERTGIRDFLLKGEALKFFVSYRVPWEEYISQHNGLNYNMTFAFFGQFNWTIQTLTVSITPPQGAEFEPLSINELALRGLDFTHSVKKSVFQETITFTFFNITPFENLIFGLTYKYSVFWASFYPTLWMGILVFVVCAIALFWRAPKPTAVPMVPIPPEDLRSFVEAYERKTRILSELESMEEKMRKGKIPRRRYKVRKKMLEGRLSTLSRDLSNLREKIRTAGPKYANIMRQVEVAETMLEGVETDIRRVEARYRRGEISKGAYGRLIEEYNNRMDRAMTTIDGVLLRLREEIR